MRILRALLGMVYSDAPSSSTVASDIMYEASFPSHVYDQLAAIAASIFVRMCVLERGRDGRARRRDAELPTMGAFASNGAHVPRYVVARICRMAAGKASTKRLFTSERIRIKAGASLCRAARGGALAPMTQAVSHEPCCIAVSAQVRAKSSHLPRWAP